MIQKSKHIVMSPSHAILTLFFAQHEPYIEDLCLSKWLFIIQRQQEWDYLTNLWKLDRAKDKSEVDTDQSDCHGGTAAVSQWWGANH